MTQSKFPLADLLIVLGTLVFGFFCFLSLNFLFFGETMPSVIWASVLAFILGGLAFCAKLLKKTSTKFKTCIIWEWALLFFFVVAALVFVYPFSHYFAVSEQKADIQSKVTANIMQADGMFVEYEDYANNRLNMYQRRLNSVVAAKKVNPSEYHKYEFEDGIPDNTQVENKMFILKSKLFPSNFEEMKQVSTDWLTEAKNTVEDWKPIGIVNVMKEVEKQITNWYENLKDLSSYFGQNEITNEFEYTLTFDNLTDKITELGNSTLLSIISAIGIYVLMLLSYFITKRHPRYPGLKMIFGTGGVAKNEL